MSTQDTTRSAPATLRLVAAPIRRVTLRVLHDAGRGNLPVPVLADIVADDPDVHADGRREVTLQLRHNHLPRLEEADLVVYDHDRSMVRYVPDEAVRDLIAYVDDRFDG